MKFLGIIAPDYWFKMPISAHFFHRLMNSKTTITLSTMAIAAVVLLFASGPIVVSQQALAYPWGGWGWHHGWGWHGGWGWHRHWWGWHGGWGWHRHWWGWHHGWWGHRW
jgi:hypothetical protein